ncbi:hypothetical protein B9Z55_008594 [Caenorhabditis nigoni]|uniref:Uncharacterized protein n=1 Tax=Caenorhabditis nigoni TaxID=1611254 RepID=A0A2G5UNH1_9PELO|nr:hypothetical protein B9Z55_008594 [Caenorhabditis nigoni]
MDTNISMDVYGIVVGIKIPDRQYFVWCKESKSDFLLQMDQRKPIELGTWVNMRFNGSEFQNPNFKVNNYVVVTPIYKTEVDGNTVRLQLEHYLNSNLKELDHWFFGKIYNNRNKEFPSDVYYLTIKKIRNASGDIWVMENVEATEPKQPEIPGIIGIVSWSGKNNNKHFVWCKERKADHDVVIFSDNSNIKVGTWLKLDLSLDQLSQEYLPCPNFTVIPYTIHPTFPSENDKLCLKLELDVLEGSRNISHPFVGEIINKFASFDKSGRYTITIMRNKIGSQVGWFLKEKKLKQPNDLIALLTGCEISQNHQNIRHQEPIQHTINPQPVARQRTSFKDELEPCQDSPPQTAPRYSRLQHQTSILGTQSDTSLTRNARPQRSVSRPRNETPAAPRQRSASRPRQQENPIRPILKQQLRSKSRIRVRFQSPNVEITGIVVAQSPYFFFVWCRERLPGLDIAIPRCDSLSLTDWIQFSITRDELDNSFKTDPKFEIREFRRMTSKFQTDLSKTGKSVTIKLDMKIERNPRIENIHHDVMGLIM